MKINRLELSGFRNLEPLVLRPSGGLNLFNGPNGHGKTNILEAFYGVLRGNSFRPYIDRKDWLSKKESPEPPLRVLVEFEGESGWTGEALIRKECSSAKWEYFLNGKSSRPQRTVERVPLVVFSPDDHRVIRGGPELRRAYLDALYTDVVPGYGEVLERFEKALRNRNRLLKRSLSSFEVENSELKAWTELLAQSALELIALRGELWPEFESRCLRKATELFQEVSHSLSLQWKPDFVHLSEFNPSVEQVLAHIQRDLIKDKVSGWTHRGPQRDDFGIHLTQMDSRTSASQGQARLLALLLKWVHADWLRDGRAEKPIFIIDDFSSELDARRRSQLLELFSDVSGQLFVSTTESSLVDSKLFSEYTCYLVNHGVVESQNASVFKGLNRSVDVGPTSSGP